MTSPQPDTSDTLTRAQVSELVTPKKAPPPVTLTCPSCGHTITLEVPGTAYCRPCGQPLRPKGERGKRPKRAQHERIPPQERPKRGSNRPIMHVIGGHAWHARL